MRAPRNQAEWFRVLFTAIAALALVGIIFATRADAAPTVTLEATPTGTVAPTSVALKWTTTEVSSCSAAGGWTGTKAATGGTETVNNVLGSTTFTISCSTSDGTAELVWTLPTTNIDGTPYDNPKGFNVYHGATASAVSSATPIPVLDPTATRYLVTGLPPGNRYFGVRTLSAADIESSMTSLVSKVVTTQTVSDSELVTLTPRPKPPGNFVVNVVAFEVRFDKWGGAYLARNIGTVPLDTECGPLPLVGNAFYTIPADAIDFSKRPKPGAVFVAQCAAG
jgi:hypothetical protein